MSAEQIYVTDFDQWCSLCPDTPHTRHDSPPLCADCPHPEHLPAGCEIVISSDGYGPEAMDSPQYCECGHEEDA